MSDTVQLFWVLVALTIAFSACWVPVGGALFVSHLGLRVWCRRPVQHAVLRNESGGLLFANLTPFGFAVAASPWPVILAPDGLLPRTPEPADDAATAFTAFADVQSVSHEGRLLMVNGKPLVACGSATAAARWTARLTLLTQAPDEQRAAWIRANLYQSFDTLRAARLAAVCRRRTAQLRWLSRMLFIYCYGSLLALMVWQVPSRLGAVMIGYAGLVLLTFVAYRRAARLPIFSGKGVASSGGWMLLVSPGGSLPGSRCTHSPAA